MVLDIVRDSTFGQIVNRLSNGRFFPYADQRPDYVPPLHYLRQGDAAMSSYPSEATIPSSPTTPSAPTSAGPTLVDEAGTCKQIEASNQEAFDVHKPHREEAEKQLQTAVDPKKEVKEPYPWLVEFEENDPDRPM